MKTLTVKNAAPKKLCKDCKHSIRHAPDTDWYWCKRTTELTASETLQEGFGAPTLTVSASMRATVLERHNTHGSCGPRGRHFEAKEKR